MEQTVPSLTDLLKELVQKEGSDLHLTVNAPPMMRIHGKLTKTQYAILTPERVMKMAYSIMNEQQKKKFEQTWELDLSFGIRGIARFRTNVFYQRGAVTVVIRQIPSEIKSFEDLDLPPILKKFCGLKNGLVLITGATGSGKSTTLAAMLDYINTERNGHMITVEDPIEFIHDHKNCIVNQREVEADTKSFANALKYALRQDPDFCLVGEMRDLETISSALTIAETGHLAFSTLHTNSASQTIERIIDVFPEEQQATVRTQLAASLKAVVTQTLLPKVGGGRVMAMEIMAVTPSISALIREGKNHQINSMLEAGKKYGMITMNDSLLNLYQKREITFEDAIASSNNPERMENMLNNRA